MLGYDAAFFPMKVNHFAVKILARFHFCHLAALRAPPSHFFSLHSHLLVFPERHVHLIVPPNDSNIIKPQRIVSRVTAVMLEAMDTTWQVS